jgi:hypothetical protein
MLNNKFDIQIQGTEIKTSTAASLDGPGGGEGSGGGSGGGTPPPGGGIIPTLLDCPPYFKWEAFKDENGNPVLRPPSKTPPALEGGDWDGDGSDNSVEDDWWWFPTIDPPHPNDRYTKPNGGSLSPLYPAKDPSRPEQDSGLTGDPSYYDENGQFLEDKYNEDYKFWEGLFNPNNPLYGGSPSMTPNGWPCWRCKPLLENNPEIPPPVKPSPGPQPEDGSQPAPPNGSEDPEYPWNTPIITPGNEFGSFPKYGGAYIRLGDTAPKTQIPGGKRVLLPGIDCDEFRKQLEDYLRRTGQSKKKPRSSSYYPINDLFKKAKWKYYNCLTPAQGTRHPDAPPIRLSDYPWWGKPWHELTPEQRELIPTGQDGLIIDLYQYCSTYCESFNPNVNTPTTTPGLLGLNEFFCQMCDQLSNQTPIHPMRPPGSPFSVPDNYINPNTGQPIIDPNTGEPLVPFEYQEGESVGNPPVQIPTGADPSIIPSDKKWKYFDDWGGWWELEMPPIAPAPFDPNNPYVFPGWLPNGQPDPNYDPTIDDSGSDNDGIPRPADPAGYPGKTAPGYAVPCRSSEWSTPISPLPQNTNGPYGMTEIVGPDGNVIGTTDSVYSSDYYINTAVKQKPIFTKIVPTVLGSFDNIIGPNKLILVDKNINNYNKKMNALYKWRNRFS